MNIQEIKDLMAQFDTSSLREFLFKTNEGELIFSKNEQHLNASTSNQEHAVPVPQVQLVPNPTASEASSPASVKDVPVEEQPQAESFVAESFVAEGDIVESPLVGVAYLAASPDKPPFVAVGDTVKKGQTLVIIEAMKVMNEVPAPCDGVITEILVSNEDVIEFGQGLVRIK
ncbi:TPA: acetyl-CoA carboxylase biotin carboxyl carrier protein [Streptococcus pyogenes]|uniref:acetyl-CoA carboxylase biotin carboxyl carrier protein n=1 Tax=Streptococcus pyogenes TaxID=1314 RepID=UPI0000D75815|nr:acetyl-CoA carboxylase biotin carboxyl carrier protein [Streptococcus pyogenes]ABF38497.1 Biotin carboxyl carrier protein of acetyl-CoA carboxylase [Streptococcus pyogenes MGAS10750]QNQ68153.1 acetyl-CoA carboxylase biotin carboxyl carrier protein [Streptococcus pyogenes]QXX55541.1 acetyl-CoA carboxylase biotin carboxyl carrier protein [Streptococcus pyogenes]VHG01626.1 acetyl-CoA carboxylase biotin carboxyl carrier protein subunit [Streptococcus pyogenes]HEP1591842.1 acetyl-CoA carboxylase